MYIPIHIYTYIGIYIHIYIHMHTQLPLGECRKESKVTNTKEVQTKEFCKTIQKNIKVEK